MSLVYYGAPYSSASPVTQALAELGVAHERVRVDLKRGDTHTPDFLALNPNGKVPTLIVDGTPMFEALAIMLWLGERFGVDKQLWPRAGTPQHIEALAWSTWAYVSYGAALRGHFFATSERLGPDYHNAPQAAHMKRELNELLTILDARCRGREYLLGDTYSLADLIVGGVVGYGASAGVATDAHPHAHSWLARCQARPSFAVGLSG